MPQITIVDKPNATISDGKSNQAQDSRQRAIAALMGSQPGQSQNQNNQQSPIVDQSKISVEELAAVSPEQPQEERADNVEGQVEEPTKPSEEVTQPEKEEPLSTQYAVLARKEKALRAKAVAQEQQMKQREAALTVREQEMASKSTIDPSKYISIDDLKRNAFSKLSELGISYDDISQQALVAQTPEAQYLRQMRQEIDGELQKVREEQANTRKSFEEQQAQSYKQALNQIRNEAKQLVNADPAYETIKETNSHNDVVDLIERTFKEEGTLLTVEQAAQAVEEHLMEEALKIARIKKIQERLKPKEPAKQQASLPKQEQAPKELKTLTNSVGSTRPLTAKERALLAFKGELNKS